MLFGFDFSLLIFSLRLCVKQLKNPKLIAQFWVF